MLWLYRFGLYLFLPFLFINLVYKGLRNKAYRPHFGERFGLWSRLAKNSNEKKVIWIHAVSVGEVNAVVPLVKKLREAYSDQQILITTMTPTGSERVTIQFTDGVWHCYLPYDYPYAINRFLKRLKPTIGIIMETEIWPNMIMACNKKNVPLFYVNVRLSKKSYQGYAWFVGLFRPLLNNIEAFALQSQPDANRLMNLGVSRNKISVTGSIKFDTNFPASRVEVAQSIRKKIAQDRPVWVVASTHDKEEELVIAVYLQARKEIPNLFMVLAPRHPERSTKVKRLSEKSGCQTVMCSQLHSQLTQTTDILILDSIGELTTYLAAGDVAFVGGSLVPIGGHNLLEASSAGIPVVFGPHMFNFKEIADLVLLKEAGIMINTKEELRNTIVRFIKDPLLRDKYGQRGREFVEENKGALDRIFTLIQRNL